MVGKKGFTKNANRRPRPSRGIAPGSARVPLRGWDFFRTAVQGAIGGRCLPPRLCRWVPRRPGAGVAETDFLRSVALGSARSRTEEPPQRDVGCGSPFLTTKSHRSEMLAVAHLPYGPRSSS